MKNLKNIFKQKFIVVLTLALISTACDSWIDHEINIDPDAPADVPMSLILPAIQQSMGYNLVGNNSVRTNNIWMQQFDGTDRQSATEARYQLTPADVNNLWGSIYTEMLKNASIIITKSQREGFESPNYQGVAQVLTATTLGISSDLFGDMPYSEALKGDENILSPVYDSQKDIYASIMSLLTDAVTNLNSTSNAYSITGDVIYGGSTTKWKKAANSIKARHMLQALGKDPAYTYDAILAAVAAGFSSNLDDYKVPFDSSDDNPIYQFMDQRTDIRMGATMVDMLKEVDDPRLPYYADKDGDGEYTGSIPGTENSDASRPGTYIASDDSPTYLMNYAELKFIEAECRLLKSPSDVAGAQAAYEAAVAASVLRVTGNANSAWLVSNINGSPVTMEKILTQKYINSFGTNQAYADYRRTGFPVLNLADGAVINQIPTRFPYAQSELDYNTQNVPSVTLTDKLWWDN
jgi:hypothetical protein